MQFSGQLRPKTSVQDMREENKDVQKDDGMTLTKRKDNGKKLKQIRLDKEKYFRQKKNIQKPKDISRIFFIKELFEIKAITCRGRHCSK